MEQGEVLEGQTPSLSPPRRENKLDVFFNARLRDHEGYLDRKGGARDGRDSAGTPFRLCTPCALP